MQGVLIVNPASDGASFGPGAAGGPAPTLTWGTLPARFQDSSTALALWPLHEAALSSVYFPWNALHGDNRALSVRPLFTS